VYFSSRIKSSLLQLNMMKKMLWVLLFSVFLSGCAMISPKDQQAGLQISTEPVAASVFINDQYVNKTPYRDENLQPGTYRVRLEPLESGYVPYELNVKVNPGTFSGVFWTFAESIELSSGMRLELEPLSDRRSSELSVVSIPDNVIFSLDGAPGQLTPISLDSLEPKEYSYQSSAASYIPIRSTVSITKGYRTQVWLKLGRDPQHFIDIQQEAERFSAATISAVLDPSETATASAESTTQQVRILATPTGWLRVRASASATAVELARVTVGKEYAAVSEKDGWFEIEYESGKTGWVSGQYVEKVSTGEQGSSAN
jgi:hypothetical protein